MTPGVLLQEINTIFLSGEGLLLAGDFYFKFTHIESHDSDNSIIPLRGITIGGNILMQTNCQSFNESCASESATLFPDFSTLVGESLLRPNNPATQPTDCLKKPLRLFIVFSHINPS